MRRTTKELSLEGFELVTRTNDGHLVAGDDPEKVARLAELLESIEEGD